jgi:hypothetical protein
MVRGPLYRPHHIGLILGLDKPPGRPAHPKRRQGRQRRILLNRHRILSLHHQKQSAARDA